MITNKSEVKSQLTEELINNSILGDLPVPAEVKCASVLVSDPIEEKRQMHYPSVHLFFSYDIVNSTMYKAMTGNWPLVIRSLLEDIRARVHRIDSLSASYLWRVIGDEMIFVLPTYSSAALAEAIDAIFEVTQRISISLKSGKFFDTLEDQSMQQDEINILKTQNTLSVKATAWIAVINDKIGSPFDNIAFDYSASSHNQSILEFLGKDIDAGFRLKEHTQDRRLCISVELAYFLLKHNKQKNLQIMDYTRLKGVWNENLYPIIWYYSSDIVCNCQREMTGRGKPVSFVKSFRYDETDNNPMVKRYFSRINTQNANNTPCASSNEYELARGMYVASSALRKIISDRNLQSKVEYFQQLLTGELFMVQHDPYAHPLELHCAVVCCDVQHRKILITHRGSDHATNPGKWEFGCAKAASKETLITTLVEHYRKAFGIEIELVVDHSRKETQPRPIAIYELPKAPTNVAKGIILVAKVSNPINPESFRPENEHDEIRWISEEELSNYPEASTVNDFHSTLKTVFMNFNSYFSEEGIVDVK